MDINFSGKRALVTGGGSGIGRGTALKLAKLGAKVFALSHVQADLDSLKAENPDIEILCVDLLEWSKTREVVKSVTPIHLLVNCAGVTTRNEILDVPMEEFDYIFGVNVKALLNVTQVVARDLLERKEKGSIVNAASILAHLGMPAYSSYAASKSAVDSYTKSMAAELSPKGIRVNAISPTVTLTPMIERARVVDEPVVIGMIDRTLLGRAAEVEEVANVIAFLLSDKSGMVNGHDLAVGGRRLSLPLKLRCSLKMILVKG